VAREVQASEQSPEREEQEVQASEQSPERERSRRSRPASRAQRERESSRRSSGRQLFRVSHEMRASEEPHITNEPLGAAALTLSCVTLIHPSPI